MVPNIFKVLEIETKENIHSSFISSIFNMNSIAREEFVKILSNVGNIQFDHEKLKAQTEKVLSSDKSARVDIYLTDYESDNNRGNTRIIIENKIFAGDQNKQLKKYHEHLMNYEKHNTALFYLTLEGKDASSHSRMDLIKGKGYYLLNYSDHIHKWLELIKKNDCIEKSVKIYIEDYLYIIKELTKYNSLMDTGFVKGGGVEEFKFNALLELRFWQELEEAINSKYEEKYQIDNLHRYYTYSKILNSHKGKGIMPNDYGIILGKTEKDNSPDVRISVNPKSKRLAIRFGKFEVSKWDYRPQIDFGDELSMVKLVNRTKMRVDIEKIINTISEFI